MADNVTISGIEILSPGTFTDANGKVVALSLADLHELAAAYDPDLQDAPAVVGHPKMDDPAYGWMRNLRVDGQVLLCDLEDVDPDFADTIKAKRFKNKSLSFFLPRSRGNPKPGKLYPKHLGLLGARAPAVPGLKPISFAADDEAVVIELAGPSPWLFRSLAAAFSSIRDHLIETLGTEKADSVIAPWLVNDLRDAASEMDAPASDQPMPAFAIPETTDEGGPMATPEQIAAFAAREAELAAREAEIKARETRAQELEVSLAAAEAQARKKDDEAFVDGLIAECRLAVGERDDVLAELAAMDDGIVIQLACADNNQISLRQAYMDRLKRSPKLVELGEMDDSDSVVALSSGEDIAAAATDYIADQAKLGRSVTAAQAVSHIMNKRS